MFKFKGFTLAEVLITLGIIGVIAALTLPALIKNHKAIQYKSKFKKSYSVISQAVRLMEADGVSLAFDSYKRYESEFGKELKKYFNIVIDCQKSNSKLCYKGSGTGYKTYDGKNQVNPSYFDDFQFVLNDGTFIVVDHPSGNKWIFVSVDLNGYSSPPNRYGYDYFTFQFIDGEIKPMGITGTMYTDTNQYCSLSAANNLNGIACTVKAKDNGDYFKNLKGL